MIGESWEVENFKKILFLFFSTALIGILFFLVWNDIERIEFSGLNACLSIEGPRPWKCKGPIFVTEGFIAEKGVFCKDKQVPQIVAKGTKYIFALHLELACSYHLFFIACTINDCKSLQIMQRPWQSILQQEIYKERRWGKEIQPSSLLFWPQEPYADIEN